MGLPVQAVYDGNRDHPMRDREGDFLGVVVYPWGAQEGAFMDLLATDNGLEIDGIDGYRIADGASTGSTIQAGNPP